MAGLCHDATAFFLPAAPATAPPRSKPVDERRHALPTKAITSVAELLIYCSSMQAMSHFDV